LPQRDQKLENNESTFSNRIDNEESPEAVDILDTRCLLKPRESRIFRIKFSPSEEGSFESEFLLTLVDNAISTFKISVAGFAEIPKLDFNPYSIFDRVNAFTVFSSSTVILVFIFHLF
jgi:hypothetical protein